MKDEGPKVVTIAGTVGPVLISADVHGNLQDFRALAAIFLAAEERGAAPTWISVGDWVHGPSAQGRIGHFADRFGEPLYDYPDETPTLLRELFALMDRFPGRVLSICGNHEHAHIGGLRTSKFHPDEAAALEARLVPEAVEELRRRFASWPLAVRLADRGVVVTHAALPVATVPELEGLRYQEPTQLLETAMTRYGFHRGEDVAVLQALSSPDEAPYRILVHGHDRDEEGWSPAGDASLLLCTSFGARRETKAYVWLESDRRYDGLGELRPGIELRRLHETLLS